MLMFQTEADKISKEHCESGEGWGQLFRLRVSEKEIGLWKVEKGNWTHCERLCAVQGLSDALQIADYEYAAI